MTEFDEGYERVFKTAGLVKEAINPMDVVNRLAKRRPTGQLARHFDNPVYAVSARRFGATTKGEGAVGKLDKIREQYNIPKIQLQMPETEGMFDEITQGLKRDPPLSPMLADNPMSTAIRKQYPKAPNMAAQMERTENALAAKLGPQRAAEMPVYLREGIDKTNFIPPGTEKMLDVVASPPDSPREAWEALKGVAAPEGSGQINMGINDPAILAHEGRHAQQFLPAEGSGYRPGLMKGVPTTVPRQNITGKSWDEVGNVLGMERDANRSVPGMIPDISPEQMAMQGAAQGTYESAVNPDLRKMMFGGVGDALPTGAQAQDVIERLMRGEDLESALEQTGAADELLRYGERTFGKGKWYDAPGTPKGLQDRFRRGAELREGVKGRSAEDVLSPAGTQARGVLPEEGSLEAVIQRNRTRDAAYDNAMEDMADKDIPLQKGVPYSGHPVRTEGRLAPMQDEVTPFDARFWQAAGQDPESTAFQAKRHQAVTDQLRTALGDDYANAYDNYVRQQIGQADPEGLFNTAMTPTQQQGKPSSFVDKLKGMFG